MKTGTIFLLLVFITLGMEMVCSRRPSRGSQRSGVCPEVPKGVFGVCAELCSGDGSCSRGMKCCSNGCGHVCQYAVFRKHGKDDGVVSTQDGPYARLESIPEDFS